MSKSILNHKKNVYSQNGEDGIIEYIFKKMNIEKGNFIEFGAWDGKHLSNSYKLFLENWSGIFIEADSDKYKDLLNNFKNCENITCINSMVGFTEKDNLDTIILNSNHQNKIFDFISIDVDGLDYNIFKELKQHLPKVICIEINAGHDPLYDKEIPISLSSNNIGQSMKVISDHASNKGYFPLCYTGNLFLIKNEYKDLFIEDLKDLKEIYLDFLKFHTREGITYLYKTFVKRSKEHKGFIFKNKTLKDFCKSYFKK